MKYYKIAEDELLYYIESDLRLCAGIDPEDIDFSDMAKAELEDNWLDREI